MERREEGLPADVPVGTPPTSSTREDRESKLRNRGTSAARLLGKTQAVKTDPFDASNLPDFNSLEHARIYLKKRRNR
jgi:hypothetical protein